MSPDNPLKGRLSWRFVIPLAGYHDPSLIKPSEGLSRWQEDVHESGRMIAAQYEPQDHSNKIWLQLRCS